MKVLKLTCNYSDVETVYSNTAYDLDGLLMYWLGENAEWQDMDDLEIKITVTEMDEDEYKKLDTDWWQ